MLDCASHQKASRQEQCGRKFKLGFGLTLTLVSLGVVGDADGQGTAFYVWVGP